jgi:glutathione synthase/RimK-type ligase-like ATP-grasp enzyme
MGLGDIVLMTDHGSGEGSQPLLEAASQLAVSATRSLGLPFGGVDLTIENGGVVFEVNVHPVLDVPGGLETLAIPFVRAHLPPR